MRRWGWLLIGACFLGSCAHRLGDPAPQRVIFRFPTTIDDSAIICFDRWPPLPAECFSVGTARALAGGFRFAP